MAEDKKNLTLHSTIDTQSHESRDSTIEFQSTTTKLSSNANTCKSFPMEILNPNSNHKSKPNSIPRRIGDCFDNIGLDPELSSFGFTFRKIGAGLENLGNTCFLNSVLQCLTYTEPFAAYLHSGKHKSSCQVVGFCAMCAIQNHVRRVLQYSGKILAPKHLVVNMSRISRNFRYARQEDAHEYMVNLLESMHKCCLPLGFPTEAPSAYEKSLVYKIFGGRLRSQVKCTECSYESNKYDPILDLSLEIAKASSLLKALRNFTDVEELDGGEKHYQCQGCNKKVKAIRQLTIHKAPYVLTIHFKRFGSLIPGQKIDKKVEFSPALDLKPFVTGTYEGDLKYTLYGVLVHAGWNTHSGHYYCFVRTSTGLWYVLDDNEVFQVPEKIVLQQKAYMLFYVRDRRSPPPKKPVVNQKENSVVVDILTETASTSVSSPVITKTNATSSSTRESLVVTTSSVKGSTLENPLVLEHETLSIDRSALLVDSVDSSLKKVVDAFSAPVSTYQMSSVSLPIVVDPLIAGSSLLAESVDSLSKEVLDVSSAPNSSSNQISSVSSSNDSHPCGALTGDNMECVNELPDCSFMQENASKEISTDKKYENISLVEKVETTAPSEVSKIGSEKNDVTQLPSESSIEDVVSCPEISSLNPENDVTMLSSSQVDTEQALCKEISDDGKDSDVIDSCTQEPVCTNNVNLESVDSTNISSQLVSEEMQCKGVYVVGVEQVDTTLLSSESNISETLCSSDSTSTELSNQLASQIVPEKDDIVVNERCFDDQHNVEENGVRFEESQDDKPTQSNDCDETVVKQHSRIRKVASINFRSNMLKASLRVHKAKKKRTKRNRKRNSEDSLLGFEPSTSEKATMESCTQGQHKKSRDLNGTCKMEESSSTLTTNRGESNKRTVEDFMSILTRGLDEETVEPWNTRNPYMSDILGLNDTPSNINIGYVPRDEWDVEYDRGKRKKIRKTKNGLCGSNLNPNPFQEIATRNTSLKKDKRDQSRSWNRPFRIP
ncbi:ubiquitinyl hydrolase 1 [Ranunculus cassubicifolius]